jgi:fluoride exporter
MEVDGMELLLVGLGGVLGSISRYALGRYISDHSKTVFPRGTFVINITGAILLGILVALQANNTSAYLFLGDGFLGAYTTFSTFMYEGFHLLRDKERASAFKYIGGSLFLGILGFTVGIELGKAIHLI